MSQAGFDLVMTVAKPLEHGDELRAIGAEVGGPIVGEHRGDVLRQQPLAHETDRGVDALRWTLEPSAAEHDEKRSLALRRESRHRAGVADFGDRGRLFGHERVLREVANLLAHAVLDDREVGLRQIGDRFSVTIEHADVDGHERDGAPERAGNGGWLLLWCSE